jgi:beta-glucanase (GH16 family)
MTLRPLLLVLVLTARLLAVDPTIRPLIDLAPAGADAHVVSNDQAQVQVAHAGTGIAVTIAPGPNRYPGVVIKPPAAVWDLSLSGHLEAGLTNTGSQPVRVVMRVDNAGDWKVSPWSTALIDLQPAASGTLRVYYGYDWGKKAFPLNPAKITQVSLFTDTSKQTRSFLLTSLASAGPPGEQPPIPADQVRIVPDQGIILAAGSTIDAASQIEANGAEATLVRAAAEQTLRIAWSAGQGERAVRFKPASGRWNLRAWLEVRVRIRNAGQAAVQPRIRLESDGGASDWASPAAPLAPGASLDLAVPFTASSVWTGEKDGSGNHMVSNAVAAISVGAAASGDARTLVIESITADLPVAHPPEWLGQRPPVPGEWSKTFDDEFDGTSLDASRWSVSGPNYWDKLGHFSEQNVIIGDGVVRLRVEKKRGHHDDDPSKPETDYAEGYLHTFDHWVQRYGYFEARMKLPSAPGLWPAFWMMPDRGQGDRQSTSNGGMEFDILEHLTGWGPNRYNIAMHWDGYGKEHKSTGSDRIYVQPDKDGFIVAGLLWEPGRLVYYGNGSEVLRFESPRVANVPAILMFTMPTGGWDNTPLDDQKLPADFVIDWVRAWQRKDLAELPPGR